MNLLGVDTGGTFTDLVHFDGFRLRSHKVLSTPQAPEHAILSGIEQMRLDTTDLIVIHGSTVATNAVLEGNGVRTVYITNTGFADVLTIGRQARKELYDLQPQPPMIPVSPALCLETGGRLGADGTLLEPLGQQELQELAAQLTELKPMAVAINLLFSFLDDRFERAIQDIVPAGIFVSRSSQILPEHREYERGIATWLNSYVGPIMGHYLKSLQDQLESAQVRVMQSHGSAISAAQAATRAVNLLLSGPAGGLMGARHVAATSKQFRLLTFDMGGTSTDVALVEGDIRLTSEGQIAGYPVAVPMVDMHTIGAGGGSVAHVDEGGLLQVGPESAGAVPGPACYRHGGTLATVTDANMVLGRLPGSVVLGGGMAIDKAAAEHTLSVLGRRLNISMAEAALGVVRIANEHMAQALRVISVQRGIDPGEYSLISFGGAGGLHVCDLAEKLAMRKAMVPVHAGVLSALGMLVAPQGRQLSKALNALLESLKNSEIVNALDAIANTGIDELRQEGRVEVNRRDSLDLRYAGQSSSLNIDWQGVEVSAKAFHVAHKRLFGHALDMPVELVNVRVGLTTPTAPIKLPTYRGPVRSVPVEHVRVWGYDAPVPIYRREALAEGARLDGPLIVMEAAATIWIKQGWSVVCDPVGNLLLELTDR